MPPSLPRISTTAATALPNKSTDHLIVTGRGTPERGEGIQYLVETLRHLIPAKRVNPLSLRQSLLALKLKEGADLKKVKVFAGHRKISSPERYRENNLEELRWAVERFHPLSTADNSKKH